jgi:hypothetical protein
VRLLLAVFETLALVVLQKAVLAAEVALAEAAVANDALGGELAFLEGAAVLFDAGHHGERRRVVCMRSVRFSRGCGGRERSRLAKVECCGSGGGQRSPGRGDRGWGVVEGGRKTRDRCFKKDEIGAESEVAREVIKKKIRGNANARGGERKGRKEKEANKAVEAGARY